MRLAVYTNMEGYAWGASEELWSQTALALLRDGHGVRIHYRYWPDIPQPLAALQQRGAEVTWRRRPRGPARWLQSLVKRVSGLSPWQAWVRRSRPDLVLINSCAHFADVSAAHACLALGVPYAILIHGGSEIHWLTDERLDAFRTAFAGAEQCFFVSDRSREVMQLNLAMPLPHSQIVNNPLKVRTGAAPPWPAVNPLWKLACVARFDFSAKGQDLALRVLGRDKWLGRPLQLSFWGETDQHIRQFRCLVERYGLQHKVELGGYCEDVEQLWSQHHALLLPSRYEAMSLAVCEAMMCARVPIVTDVGGNAELIKDGQTGFLAAAATEQLVDEALERAWQCRRRWRDIGQLAAQRLQARYEADPVDSFRAALSSLAARAARRGPARPAPGRRAA